MTLQAYRVNTNIGPFTAGSTILVNSEGPIIFDEWELSFVNGVYRLLKREGVEDTPNPEFIEATCL